MENIKLKKADVKALLELTHADYKGRKFQLDIRETYTMQNYWSGGTKHDVICVMQELDKDLKVIKPSHLTTVPWNAEAHKTVKIPKSVIFVERVWFCGKDLGLYFIVSPDSLWLPRLIKEESNE